MKWFYSRISLIILTILISGGTFYIHYILVKSYKGDRLDIYISWILYVFLISYQAYTLYYDSLLLGKGMVKRNKQIIVISQLFFIVISLILILVFKMGLIALVIGQLLSVVLNRTLSFISFYDKETKNLISSAENIHHKDVLKDLSPNAIKIGITSLGSFLINKSSIFIGSLILPLADIASFGISKQVIDLVAIIAAIWFSTYYPKMIQFRVNNEKTQLKKLYVRSEIIYIVLFILMGTFIVFFGNDFLVLIKTNTLLINTLLLASLILVTFLEINHTWAGSLLLTKNEVPFFKASIVSGLFTIILLFLFLYYFKWGVISLIIAPGIAQLVYQNWKWPLEAKKDLNIKNKDYKTEIKSFLNKLWTLRLS